MEFTKEQKLAVYEKLTAELVKLREESNIPIDVIAKYVNVKTANLPNLETGCPEFGTLDLYQLMQWAAAFGKTLNITFEDFTPEQRLESYNLIKNRVRELNRLLCG